MVIGMNHFGGNIFAGINKFTRNQWNQMCPAKTDWIQLVKIDAEITRCEDAN